jgi:hypothetical protein
MKSEIGEQYEWGATQETDITPSWIGGDGIFTHGTDAQGSPVLKRIFTDESAVYASPVDAVISLMQAASRRQIAPPILQIGENSIIMDSMPQSWRNVKLDELRDPLLLGSVLEQHRRVHTIPASELVSVHKRELLETVNTVHDHYLTVVGCVPRDVDRILHQLEPFASVVDSFHEQAVPCHGDGAASNVLFCTQPDSAEADKPLLTGWIVSGLMDPLEEAGSILAEIEPYCGMPGNLIMSGLGLPPEALPVAQVFGIFDDLLWCLIGLLRSATSKDTTVDYAKYGLWRLTKARNQLASPTGPLAWLKQL